MGRGTTFILACLLATALAGPAHADAIWQGFNDNSTLREQLTPAQDAELLAGTGANSMRIVVDWKWVEHAPGTLDLSLYDPIYEAMLARGIRPLLNIMGSPRWAWSPWTLCFPLAECHVPPARSKDAAWGSFVAAVARRFPQAAAIEIWNEPNLKLFFHPAPDARRYTELLRIGRDAVKRVAPDMPVLGGALAAVMTEGGLLSRDESLRSFLTSMYANGARGLMDGLSVHPYPDGLSHGGTFEALDTALEVRDTAGDPAPLWVTEVGISSTDGYTEAEQAAVLGDLVPRLLQRPEMRGVYVHTLIDADHWSGDRENGFGVLRASGERKPAYCSVAAAFGKQADCTQPTVSARARAVWDAQELLQGAVERALQWRRRIGSFAGLSLPTPAARLDARPGALATPRAIAVLPVPGRPDGVRLCNTTRAAVSLCVTALPGGPWWFTAKRGTIAELVAATDAGTARRW